MKDRLLPLLLILGLAALLTPLLQGTIRAMVLPFLYIIWVARLLIQSIPQAGLWGGFIVIAVLIAAASLLKKPPPMGRARRPPKPHPARIETWAKLIQQADQETYYRWQLAQHLRKLTLAVLAHDERLAARQIQQRLVEGQLNIPPDIDAYLKASLTSFNRLAPLTARSRLHRPAWPLELDPERVVTFLEERLSKE